MYCIVSIIYIAPFAVHTNQKRFQCKRPRAKRYKCNILGCLDRALRSAVSLNLAMSLGICTIFSAGSLLSVWFSYRVVSLVRRCLLGLAPVYLHELCSPLLSAMSSQLLRSSQQGFLLARFIRTSTKLSHVFSEVSPSTWNGFLSELRIFPYRWDPGSFNVFKRLAKLHPK